MIFLAYIFLESASEGRQHESYYHLLDYIKGFPYPTRVLSAPHQITHGLNEAHSLRIISGITFPWLASTLEQSEFFRTPVYLQSDSGSYL